MKFAAAAGFPVWSGKPGAAVCLTRGCCCERRLRTRGWGIGQLLPIGGRPAAGHPRQVTP